MNSRALRLFCVSATIMLLELICIRWIPAYIRLFGFFINFVLLGSLLGIGTGILVRREIKLPIFPILLAVLMAFVLIFRKSFHVPTVQVLFYSNEFMTKNQEGFYLLPTIFILVAIVFLPLGRILGASLEEFKPLRAYFWDILGSLSGIVLFGVMSYFSLPPGAWFAALAIVAAPLFAGANRFVAAFAFVAIIIACSIHWGGPKQGTDVWSPYYRIQYWHQTKPYSSYSFNVNNIGHQIAQPYQTRETFYFRPYDLLGKQPFKRVLIIGAGTGTDVSVALHNGVQYVDAVEIDPQLYALGKKLNPDQPYSDPRVHVHINDGRAFLRHTDAKYDLIIFALTDSLTLTSGYANLRLESFLFTEESMREARAHLTDNGVLVLYNFYREPWSIHKLAGLLQQAFGEPPFVTTYGSEGKAAAFLIGPKLSLLDKSLDHPYALDAHMSTGSGVSLPVIGEGRLSGDGSAVPSTDNWPFFYMQAPGFPSFYIGALAMVAGIALVMIGFLAPRGTLARFKPNFFFLGAAFMLLEARSLVIFSLLFGTTWIVNALVFFAILSSVLVAILITARWRIQNRWPLFVLLFIVLAANYLSPPSFFLDFGSTALRYTAVAVFAFLPVLIANLIFSNEFAGTEKASAAFAYNLIGIMFGGMFEYAALLVGYQDLLLIVTFFYALAFLGSWLEARKHRNLELATVK